MMRAYLERIFRKHHSFRTHFRFFLCRGGRKADPGLNFRSLPKLSSHQAPKLVHLLRNPDLQLLAIGAPSSTVRCPGNMQSIESSLRSLGLDCGLCAFCIRLVRPGQL
eukprot:5240461-Amphidinium_carterae.2